MIKELKRDSKREMLRKRRGEDNRKRKIEIMIVNLDSMMILEKKASIREVMAFPKTGTSEDLLFGSPSQLSDKKVEEMNVRIMR